MEIKVHWIIDGLAELEADSIEDAEKLIQEKIISLLKNDPAWDKQLTVGSIQGVGYLKGQDEETDGIGDNGPNVN